MNRQQRNTIKISFYAEIQFKIFKTLYQIKQTLKLVQVFVKYISQVSGNLESFWHIIITAVLIRLDQYSNRKVH